MHNLEQRIAEWRQTMRARPGVGRETLDELEVHLRDALEPLLRSGMSEPEAFQRVVTQLGHPRTISSEFQKLNQRTWLPVKVAIGMGITAALALAVFVFARFDGRRADLLLASHIFSLTLGYFTTLIIGALAICFVCQRSFAHVSTLRMQSVSRATFAFGSIAACLTAIGIVLGMIWAKTEWSRLWAWDPKETAALVVLVWLICFVSVHQLRGVTDRVVLLLGVVGNIIVSFAWLGPQLWGGVHSYGTSNQSAILLAAVISHVAFLLIGLAPACWLRPRKA